MHTPGQMAGALPPEAFGGDLIAEIKHLRAFAICLAGSVSDADDLVRETLLSAWSRADQFPVGTKWRLGLLTILRNLFYSRFHQRPPEAADRDSGYAGRLPVSKDQIGQVDLQDLGRALATLPSHLREVLILVGASGYTCEEAAAICQVEIATIQSRLDSARLELIMLLDL